MKRSVLASLAVSAVTAAALALSISPASASAPTPFPAYDNGRVLVTAHPVYQGERVVIRGRGVTLGSVSHPGPAFVAHVLGGLPASWARQVLAVIKVP